MTSKRKCEECGEWTDCDLTPDPYQQEINDVEELRWLCRECYGKICEDV